MTDSHKSKARLISELELLRSRLAAYERGAGEGASGEGEEQVTGLIDASPQGVYIHEHHIFLYVNRAFTDLLGYGSPGEVLAMGDVFEIYAPAERERLHGFYEARVAGRGAPVRYEYQGLRRDGSPIWLENFVQKTTWKGRPAILATVVDISVRKAAEAELRESQALLQGVFDALPVWVYVKDRESTQLLANRKMAEDVGMAVEAMQGLPMKDATWLNDEEKAIVVEMDKRVFRGGMREEISEHQNTRADGEVRFNHVIKVPLRDGEGNVTSLVGVAMDITERKRAEEELRKSEESFRTVIEQAGDALFVIDPSTAKFVEANNQASVALGYTRDELLNLSVLEIGVDFNKEKFDGLVKDLASGKPQTIQGIYRRKDGSTYPVEVRAGLVEIHGNPMLLALARDVSERKLLEEQLRESQKMEAVGQLAGGVAHDFNNAMQVIINSAHFIREGPDKTESVLEFADIILHSAQRTAELTRQLLAYSRKAVIQTSLLDLNELTSNLLRMLGRVIGEDINLELKRGENLRLVKADAGMLEQVILNLCVNARDAMPNGGRLTIETRNHFADQAFCDAHGWEQPGPYVTLAVGDTGVGMAPETLEHAFEPFFTTKDVGQGTGLGLAMAYGIVQQHKGQIEASSKLGLGTTFEIHLPAVDGHKEAEEAPAAVISPGGNETILVAEDEEAVLSIITKSLEGKGYRVVAAKDGEEAVDVFKENAHRIDLVLLDLVMPKLRGREVFAQIRGLGSNVPFICSTGYSPDSDDTKFVARERLRLIQKPYGPNELFTLVREVLDQQ